jgi:hypothetical protein
VLLKDRDAFWLGPLPGPRWPRPFAHALEIGRDLWVEERRLWLRWRDLRARTHADPTLPQRSALRIGAAPDGAAVLQVRSAAAGDHVRHARGTVPLKQAFRSARFSLRERRMAAVVVDAEQRVLWVIGAPGVRELDASGTRCAWELVPERVSGPSSSC